MSDLDQIQQARQGARDRRGRFARGPSGNPEGRAAAATTSIALLAGEGEALTTRPSSWRSPALRLCLGRIVGPHRELTVEFTMPAIRNAADLAGQRGKR